MSQMYPPQPARAPSSASHLSAASGQSGILSNGSNHNDDSSPPFSPNYGDRPNNQQTPQPHPMGSNPGQYVGSNPSAFLPPLTSSPPPHAPPYIPPPQHAMAPDPIHSLQMGMMPPPMSPSSMMAWNGPANGWRAAGPSQIGYTGFRQNLPNGHGIAIPHNLPPNPHEPPYHRASISGAINPLQQAMMGNGRPGSAHGEGRRRRDREEEGDRDTREEEVISTIFVVGFPDDMLEREFQNIFTFAPGFEAATLKFPSGSRSREPTAALLAELQRLEANQAQMLEHGEVYPGLEEQIAALQLIGTSSSSSTTTPSAAISLTPSAPSGATFGSTALPQMPTRRQTIGFARFKTRGDAIAAKEHLQGRKIDPLTGATLKAEMAKKNLHTKRATSGEELVGLLLRSGRLANLMGTAQNTPIQPGGMSAAASGYVTQQQSAREVWDSWPGQLPAQPSGTEREPPAISQSGFSSSLGFSDRSFAPGPSAPPANQPHPASNQSNASTSPPLSITSPNQRPTDSKALLALAEEADALEGWNIGTMGIGLDNGYRNSTQASGERQRERSGGSQSSTGIHMQAPQALSGSLGRGADVNFGSSPPGGSDHLSDGGRGLGNPADQNPPINTLYVGNLPAISPPTHPPNFLEESLRALFSRCQGFKRMSFRQKINGPMCFVEFEDVVFATQAIGQLYGHNLGGLVKGGIRLSYSKNSLGQRGSAHPTGISTSMFGGIAHTVALAGMSTPPSANSQNSGANYAHGLQLQSAPIPQPPDLRRGSEATGLSPTAQPFNATLPMTTSPRSRYFGTSPNKEAVASATFGSFTPGAAVPTAINPPNNGANPPGSMSPVASPIRTPASYSWVSTSGGGQGGVGNGYGFEGFSSTGGLPSLDGAASAWGAGQTGNGH
ncbi:hypothetical protein BCR39DRAFT_506429 [Naematelia encephala]|uniref:RRM domain-containing protein n=1 Tax=Naematelia encephala TaxID=71784 RepID=A0A1Y2AWK1_9TREE|nr:hypothetical protein BCR39DRAFT_506429 [Naematelia encephala]